MQPTLQPKLSPATRETGDDSKENGANLYKAHLNSLLSDTFGGLWT